MRKRVGKKAQLTLWIIIAIVIVAAIVLLFYLTPLKNIIVPSKPSIQLQDCVEDKIEKAVSLVSKQGGSVNPVLALSYQGNKIEYLCYTNQYYKTCVMQQPLLKQHIEREILDYVKPEAQKCMESLKKDLKRRGYVVGGAKEKISVSILPQNIKVVVSGFSVTKAEAAERYERFELNYKSKLYNLIMLSSSILNWEARYGDSDITTYMIYYPSVKVEKYKQQDGSKIYILTDTRTKDKFVFAIRSLSWPAGYGFGETHKPIAA